MGKVVFNMRMDEELKRRLDAYSEESGVPRSRIVSVALSRHLDSLSRKAQALRRDLSFVDVGGSRRPGGTDAL